jgi:hypothetical protein
MHSGAGTEHQQFTGANLGQSLWPTRRVVTKLDRLHTVLEPNFEETFLFFAKKRFFYKMGLDCYELVTKLSFAWTNNLTITKRQVTICHEASSENCKIPVEHATVMLTSTEQIYARC